MPTVLRPLLLLIALVAMASAQAREDEAPRPVEREDAGARVRQVERDGGRVLQAEPMQRGGREVYRLKVLTPEGRVRVLQEQHSPARQPAREARFELRDRDTARPGTLIRERPRARSPEPAADEPRPPRRDEIPGERDRN